MTGHRPAPHQRRAAAEPRDDSAQAGGVPPVAASRPAGRRRSGCPRVALVGRPNVGKSSLFNRLIGRREAIVLDRPGVTRDRIERHCHFAGRRLLLQDTGGIVPDALEELTQEVTRQALVAVADADAVLLLVDGRAGITPLDEAIAGILRPFADRVVVVVNKIDGPQHAALVAEAWRLGLSEPLAVSAEHGFGIEDLEDRLAGLLAHFPTTPVTDERVHELPDPAVELHVAVVGRPNVGKSSLVNRLLGAERVAVSEVPGTTRDAIDVVLEREGRRFRLIDTAGLRRRAKTETSDEDVGLMLTRRRLARAHVAILVVDALQGLTSGDVGIAGEILRLGRPLVLALNKWDLVTDPEERTAQIKDQVETRLPFLPQVSRVTISAKTGQRAVKVLDAAARLADGAIRRLSTAELNRFLDRTLGEHAVHGGSSAKMLYITQTGTLPPRFVIFCRDPRRVDDTQRRFVENRLRETFDLGPIPVVLHFRASPRRRTGGGSRAE